ncbi:MAG: SGNH/GDSL hydrolase family protein [Clostridiales bacterium]|nr:SGNH/GDSL hydrolase family protein [Clostridiales bacterium]
MILTNDELKKIYFGAYEFEETADGYLKANQYSAEQMDYFRSALEMWYERCDASTAKTLEFTTDATEVSFEYRMTWKCSEDSVEIYVDGLAHQIVYVKDMKKEGSIRFSLPEGTHKVVIYLAIDATLLIRNFSIDSDYQIPVKNTKVLWLGDSITQGYGPLRSSESYVSIANRYLEYDILNQGIGGYIYDKKSLMKMPGYTPDKIIVALGTNQYGAETMTDVEEYYETLEEIYGQDIPVLCISPIWRGDNIDALPVFYRYCENIKAIAGSYPNIKVIDGLTLVPHLEEYYLDNLHPNCVGTETYASNLIREIKRIGF